ncbi:MAG TPA: phosphate regulon transcriptional regulator PhoB [Rhodospirillaceae bacterium]|nr:phosphate regulon transcriptional regulator PhoB [Rhodospirillaceae bacterium]
MMDRETSVKPLVMVVEDETALVTMLRYNLEKEGYRVCEALDGEEALTVLAEREPDLVLLDWMLPVLSGIEVCRQIRRKAKTRDLPVIMLTARGEEADKIRGLNIGADDYLTKPFSLPELMARVRALLRRARPVQSKGVLHYEDIRMDQTTHRVTRGSRHIHLGPTEYRLLQFFLQHPGSVFSREDLLNGVWGPDIYVEPRTVDVHIRRLRIALNGDSDVDVIRTVRAAGYALDTGMPLTP